MRKKIIIAVSFVVIIILAICIFLAFRQTKPADQGAVTANQQQGVAQVEGEIEETTNESDEENPPVAAKRTDPEILEVITKNVPSLIAADSQALFTVSKSQKTTNAWYVVTIKHKDPTVGSAKVILKDNGGPAGLVLIAGPGTYFDPQDIYLPNEVRVLL